jgi:hypothetical protein
MLSYELLRDEAILIVRPESALASADFEAVAAEVDPYVEEHGKLRGLVIEAENFRGWQDFAGLVTHLRFIRDHQKQIAKVAAVTDSEILAILPQIANHFVSAEVKSFDIANRDAALAWIRQE